MAPMNRQMQMAVISETAAHSPVANSAIVVLANSGAFLKTVA